MDHLCSQYMGSHSRYSCVVLLSKGSEMSLNCLYYMSVCTYVPCNGLKFHPRRTSAPYPVLPGISGWKMDGWIDGVLFIIHLSINLPATGDLDPIPGSTGHVAVLHPGSDESL